jgi:hypothetical protein
MDASGKACQVPEDTVRALPVFLVPETVGFRVRTIVGAMVNGPTEAVKRGLAKRELVAVTLANKCLPANPPSGRKFCEVVPDPPTMLHKEGNVVDTTSTFS